MTTLAASCLVCGTALAGVLGAIARVGGVRRSGQNPNLCNRCEAHIADGSIVELAVLFADLTGYTTMTHELGPQKTAELLDRFLRTTTDVLVRWDGFVSQFVGDEVMAFFNVPLRRDDFGKRAVSAAVAIQTQMPELGEQFGLELRATIGIARGHARVGRVGSEEIRHYSAIGDVVNRAARLVSRVDPGGILVDGGIYEQVAGDFPDARREAVQLKGFPEPVEVARLEGGGGLADDPPSVDTPQRSLRIASVLSAILAAPCAAYLTLSPIGVAVGIGSFGLGAVLPFLDQSLIRVPLLTVASLGAVANLFVVSSGRGAANDSALAAPTTMERARTRIAVASSIGALGFVAFELIAHAILH